jgi:hypothetical protein
MRDVNRISSAVAEDAPAQLLSEHFEQSMKKTAEREASLRPP